MVVDPLKTGQYIRIVQLAQTPVAGRQDRRVNRIVVIADQPRVVAGLSQCVTIVLLRIAQRGLVVDRTCRTQIAAGIDARPARTAGRGLVKTIAEMRALVCQLVEVRRLHHLVAGHAQAIGAKLVG